MAYELPVTFRAAPLPAQAKYTPQQFLDALVARLALDTQDSLALFTIGATAPSSDTGPWLKNGTTWYVWDNITASYIPEILDSKSLRYIASATAPAQADYTLWIELSAGKAIALKYYSGGAWKDVYEDKFATYSTTAAMNTAIGVAQAAATSAAATANQQYPFRARKSASAQIYTAGTGDEQIVFDVEDYDVLGNFAANQFVAPATGYYTFKASAYLSLDSGTPTAIDRQLKLRVNGVVVCRKNIIVSDETGGATIDISDTRALTAGDIVDVVINVTSTGASDWEVLNDSTNTFFTGNRVLTQ